MPTSSLAVDPPFSYDQDQPGTYPVTVRNKVSGIPGSIAIWILVFAEFTEFALFIIAFLLAKVHYPEVFSVGPDQLNTFFGATNTLVLISSSFFVARAMRAIRIGDKKTSMKWLKLAIGAGCLYCGIKGWEYVWNDQHGIDSRTDMFFALYYYLTFNHLLHVLMGICTLTFVTLNLHFDVYNKDNHEGLENAANYWHMIDLVWIIIFPLLYVLR